MSEPGFEPGSTRPQRVVLTTRRFGPIVRASTTILTTSFVSQTVFDICAHYYNECIVLENVHLPSNIYSPYITRSLTCLHPLSSPHIPTSTQIHVHTSLLTRVSVCMKRHTVIG